MSEIVEFTAGDEAALAVMGLAVQNIPGNRVLAHYAPDEVLRAAEKRLGEVERRVPTQGDVELAAWLGGLCGQERGEMHHLWERTKVAKGANSVEALRLEGYVSTLKGRVQTYAATWGAHFTGTELWPPEKTYLEDIVDKFRLYAGIGTVGCGESFEVALQRAGLRPPLPTTTRR